MELGLVQQYGIIPVLGSCFHGRFKFDRFHVMFFEPGLTFFWTELSLIKSYCLEFCFVRIRDTPYNIYPRAHFIILSTELFKLSWVFQSRGMLVLIWDITPP